MIYFKYIIKKSRKLQLYWWRAVQLKEVCYSGGQIIKDDAAQLGNSVT